MDFETIDWNVEAKRVARAFDFEGECEFVPTTYAHEMEIVSGGSSQLKIHQRLYLNATYSLYGREFGLWQGWEFSQSWSARVVVKWNNRIVVHLNPSEPRLFLAHALFRLDLLTPETEAELKVSLTAHERIEWTLEREERYGY